jgi:Uncharacterized protein conserved in bacteria
MKNITCLLLLIFASAKLSAQHKIEVVIKQINNPTGTIMVALFSNEKDFLTKATASQQVKAEKGEVKVYFENVAAGEYAVSVIHDANSNGELDKNFIGIPKEGFGFSNDAKGKFGPPDFAQASFNAGKQNAPLVLNLFYY